MNVPLGTRKLLVASGTVVILVSSVGEVGLPGRRRRDARGGAQAVTAGRRHGSGYLPREKTNSAANTRLMK